ncbi:hypothetical protein VAE115_370265 [Vibrio aestuarianus]|nr:hypothetical protein VAE115_370265 [Vibrio aestuarianus]CAH8232981.1 hypothetical protein VAE016_410268 [Vibrio aestuarianus]CAH8236109.1 hypothetical protein VAE122_3040267 [Vibrio aestuarianus]
MRSYQNEIIDDIRSNPEWVNVLRKHFAIISVYTSHHIFQITQTQ